MITKKEIEHIAELAQLELTDEELDKFSEQLSQIIGSFEKLDELDTEDVEPTANSITMKNILRKDEVKPSMDQEEVLKNAPDKKAGHFRVPEITIDEDSS